MQEEGNSDTDEDLESEHPLELGERVSRVDEATVTRETKRQSQRAFWKEECLRDERLTIRGP